MDSTAFLTRYPEFGQTNSNQLDAVLEEAAGAIDTDVYGSRFDEAHGALAAHLLWTTPEGVSFRLEGDSPPEGKSRYWQEFIRVRREVAPRAIVT